MLIGASCSVSTEPLAELSPFWSLVQVASYVCACMCVAWVSYGMFMMYSLLQESH